MASITAHILSSAADIVTRTNATISALYGRLAAHYASQIERSGKEKMCLAFSVALALFDEAQAGNMSLLHFEESVCVHGTAESPVRPEADAAQLTFYVDDRCFYIFDDEAWMKNAIWDSFLLIAHNMGGSPIAQCFYDHATHYQLYAFSVERGYAREQQAGPAVSPHDIMASQLQASMASQAQRTKLIAQLADAQRQRDEHRRRAEEELRRAEEHHRRAEEELRRAEGVDRLVDQLTMQLLCEPSQPSIINTFFTGSITNQGTITGNVV